MRCRSFPDQRDGIAARARADCVLSHASQIAYWAGTRRQRVAVTKETASITGSQGRGRRLHRDKFAGDFARSDGRGIDAPDYRRAIVRNSEIRISAAIPAM